MAELKTTLSRVAWPIVVGGGLTLAGLGIALGLEPAIAAYAAAILGGALILALERILPYRARWHPSRSELWLDTLYLVGVQTALPAVLALTVAAPLALASRRLEWSVTGFWPHAWPIWAQVVCMLLAADLLRYALHVAAHRWPPLWRLHATHHAPEKLYALSVARFHPLEKSLQYTLDALPFALLGVQAEVLALYFVFYALNGLLQHANVDVRLGWLNWVVSGPELHRWHHSRIASECAANFGNNLIVWDVIFGTRRLPRYRSVARLGCETPPAPVGVHLWDAICDFALRFLLGLRMRWIGATVARRFATAAAKPRETQLAVLRHILKSNRDCLFGRRHEFRSITSYAEYRRNVPVSDYEDLRSYIEGREQRGTPGLTVDAPLFYAQTSGTTAEPKLIPVTRKERNDQKRLQSLFAYFSWRHCPAAFRGRILAIVSPAIEGCLPSGRPFGSASGQMYRAMPRLARAKYVLPPEVFDVVDYDVKYRLILRLAAVDRDITSLGTANPSTILKLADVLRADRLALLRDIESESFADIDKLADGVRHVVAPRLRCSPARRRELRQVLSRPEVRLADLWPRLRLLSSWTGGSAGIALEKAREELPSSCEVAELGFLASEIRGTTCVDVDRKLCAPNLAHAFFEFVERDDWDSGGRRFLTIDELRDDQDYYVLVTTKSGLYRYFMNDIVRVTGWYERTPTLAFVQKGKGVTNLTGEKLYESQVIEAMEDVQRSMNFRSPFFLALADVHQPGYEVLLETETPLQEASLADELDRALCRTNLEYAAKRASGRLAPLRASRLMPGAREAYKSACVAQGQREGQFKMLCLMPKEALPFDLAAFGSARGDAVVS